MDPFSIAAGVVSLVAFAYEAAKDLDRMVQEFKSTPNEMKRLASQVQHITAALQDFKELFVKRVVGPHKALEQDDTTRDDQKLGCFMPNQLWLRNMESLLISLNQTIQELKKALSKFEPKQNRFIQHWKWQSLKPETASLQQDLDRSVQTLLFMMSTFTSMSDAYLREEVHNISEHVVSKVLLLPSSLGAKISI